MANNTSPQSYYEGLKDSMDSLKVGLYEQTLVSMPKILAIAAKDAPAISSSKPKEFAQANAWQYFYGVNTWLWLVKDVTHDVRYLELALYIERFGLLAAIKACTDQAAQLLRGEQPTTPVAFLTVGIGIKDQLQILRFLKRFTPLKCDLLYDKALKAWTSVEEANRKMEKRGHSVNSMYPWLVRRVKEYMDRWFRNYKGVTPYEVWMKGAALPSGASFIAGQDIIDKMMGFASIVRCPNTGMPLFRATRDGSGGRLVSTQVKPAQKPYLDSELIHYEDECFRLRSGQIVRFSGGNRHDRLVFVPKNWKSPRIVCPESPAHQMMQKAIRDEMVKVLPKSVLDHVLLHDQTPMELHCKDALRLGLATLDLSHASDSQSLRLVWDVTSGTLCDDLMFWRPTHIWLPRAKRARKLRQFSPMGTGNTWFLMACILYAVCMVACDLLGVKQARRILVYIFGDDIIIPAEIAELVMGILEVLGFEVNEEKSHWRSDDPYRESCGKEYYGEEDVQSLYYPRFPVQCTADGKDTGTKAVHYDPASGGKVVTTTLSRFVSLQRHMLASGHYATSRFLCFMIKNMEPRMTSSIVGDETTADLWGPYPDVRVVDKNSRDKQLIVSRSFSKVDGKYSICHSKQYHKYTTIKAVVQTYLKEVPETPDKALVFKTWRKELSLVTKLLNEKVDAQYPRYEADGLELEAWQRPGHLTPAVTIKSLTATCEPKSDDWRAELVNEWLYLEYLAHGPQLHDDPVLALMGMTQRRDVKDPASASVGWRFD